MIEQVHVDRLDKICAKYVNNDFRRYNSEAAPLKPYPLGDDTVEALEVFKLALLAFGNGGECLREDEERIKGYLLRHIKDWDDEGREVRS